MAKVDFKACEKRWKQSDCFKDEFKSLHDFLRQAFENNKTRESIEGWLEENDIFDGGDSAIDRVIILGWIFGHPPGFSLKQLDQAMMEAEDPDNFEDPDFFNPLDPEEAMEHSVNIMVEFSKAPQFNEK